jgi:hypothetical protein
MPGGMVSRGTHRVGEEVGGRRKVDGGVEAGGRRGAQGRMSEGVLRWNGCG